MVDVSRTFTVRRPLDEVVAYLRDFANAVDWDPGTQKCERIGADVVVIDPAVPLGLVGPSLDRPYDVVLHGAADPSLASVTVLVREEGG